jgi:hypothetical protein
MHAFVRRVGAVGVAVALVLLAACGGGDEPSGPTATVPQPTTTTDPYAIPDVIDEAYVNRVLAGLDQAVGDVTRIVVATRTITPEAVDRLKAIYVGDYLQLTVDLYQDDLFNSLAGYRENPGNQATAVTRMISATPACIFAQVNRDYSAVSLDPDPSLATQWVALVPIAPANNPDSYNPTRWAYTYDGLQEDLSQPPDPCAGS